MSIAETTHDYIKDRLRPAMDQIQKWFRHPFHEEVMLRIEKLLAEYDQWDEHGPEEREDIWRRHQWHMADVREANGQERWKDERKYASRRKSK